MEDKYIKEIKKNNKDVSELLSVNEHLLEEAGYNPPVNNYVFEIDDKIKIPTGYVRTVNKFTIDYKLNDLILENTTRKNIAYALQLSDYYNYIVNRFNIWGPVETMFYKQMFVNVISVIEALILESSNRINGVCKECDKSPRCSNVINKSSRANMKDALKRLHELGIVTLSSEETDRLIELYDLRNKIHIRLNEQNEFLSDVFNIELYNESIIFLKKMDEMLYENAIPLFDDCIGFKQKYV